MDNNIIQRMNVNNDIESIDIESISDDNELNEIYEANETDDIDNIEISIKKINNIKQKFNDHVDSCDKRFVCMRCGFNTTSKYSMKNHLKRKIVCKVIYYDKIGDDCFVDKDKKEKNNGYKCPYCYELYSKRYNLQRHIKSRCHKDKNNESSTHDINIGNINNNNTNNIFNLICNDVKILSHTVPFGNEKYNHISSQKITSMLGNYESGSILNALVGMLVETHFNKDVPMYHNLRTKKIENENDIDSIVSICPNDMYPYIVPISQTNKYKSLAYKIGGLMVQILTNEGWKFVDTSDVIYTIMFYFISQLETYLSCKSEKSRTKKIYALNETNYEMFAEVRDAFEEIIRVYNEYGDLKTDELDKDKVSDITLREFESCKAKLTNALKEASKNIHGENGEKVLTLKLIQRHITDLNHIDRNINNIQNKDIVEGDFYKGKLPS